MPLIVPPATVPPQSTARASVPARQPKARAKTRNRKAGVAELAAFFRALGTNPALLERFSSSPAGRARVLAKFNLSEEHESLLVRGRVQEIVGTLVANMCTLENCTINVGDSPETADQLCDHADCNAFRVAAKRV